MAAGGLNMAEEKMFFLVSAIVAFIVPFLATLYFTGQLDNGNFMRGDFILALKYGIVSLIFFLFLQVARIPYFIGFAVYLIFTIMAISTFPLWFGINLDMHFWVISINPSLLTLVIVYLIIAAFTSYFETKGATSYEGFS